MNGVGSAFFILMSLLALFGAVVTVAGQNPIRCAVGLLTTIVGIAGLFLKLNAQFMAAIQLIVYAGAVVVLFVFVIMLLGPDATAVPPGLPKARASRIVAGLLMAALAVVGAVSVLSTRLVATAFEPVRPEHGSVELVGKQIFTQAVVPFELATALLIVAVVGAIAVARTRGPGKPEKSAHNRMKGMFHGPLHPRDAGRPLEKEHV
jgi:NADH-quinone oxidoreductase subunit J